MAIEVVKSVRASGGDYTSYNAFVTGEGRDLVTADEIAVAEIYNDWANGGLTTASPAAVSSGNGWSTDADHPVIFRAAAGHKHNGRPFDVNGHYTGANLCVSGSGSLSVLTWHARFRGLILHHAYTGTSARNLFSTSVTTSPTPDNLIELDSCLVGVTSTHSTSTAVRAQGRRHLRSVNTVVWDSSRGFQVSDHSTARTELLNCTVVGARTSAVAVVNSSGTVALINVLADGSGVNDFDNIGSATVENCAASDSSLPAGNGNRGSQAFTFEDAGNFDFRLTAEDEGALGYGQDLSAYSPHPFSVDALGLARSTPWDIGAFRTITGSPPTGDTSISLVTITSDGIVLDVDDSGVSDADGYEYQLGTVGPWVALTAETVTGLDSLADYQVRVAPVNAHGRGAASNLISFRTLANTTIYNKQSHAASVATITGTEITLPGGVTKARTYAIHRATDGTWAVHALHEDWEAANDQTINVPAAQLTCSAVLSAVVLGALSLSPVTADISPSASAGAVVVSSTSVTPAPASATTSSSASIQESSLVLSVDTAQCNATAQATVILGDLGIVPSQSISTSSAADPSVVVGSVSVTPLSAAVSAQSPNPTTLLDGLALTPANAIVVADASQPQVTLGSVVITVTAADTSPTAVSPTTLLDGLALTPANARVVADVSQPQVTLGSVVIAVTAADTSPTAVSPSVGASGVIVTPDVASIPAISVDPIVLMSDGPIIPQSVSANTSASGPEVILGSISAVVSAATTASSARADVVIGSIPTAPAIAMAGAVSPIILTSSIVVVPMPCETETSMVIAVMSNGIEFVTVPARTWDVFPARREWS